MRLIDADALREHMYHEAFETDTKEQRWDSGCWIRYKMFERIIDSEIAIDPVKWIPVTERLPEKNGRYLVTCEQWGAWEVDWDIWYATPKPGWLWDHGVTAWMPLPKPWGGEEDEL